MRDAWEQEYVEYVTARLPALRRLACLLCGDEHRADDIVQDAITKLYVHWDKARAATNLDAYVRMVLVRTFVDEKRLAWSRVRLFASTPDRPNRVDTSADDRTVVRAALSGLPALGAAAAAGRAGAAVPRGARRAGHGGRAGLLGGHRQEPDPSRVGGLAAGVG
jgi:DNA-directed RNA polymerase specialized sigma24 family protein